MMQEDQFQTTLFFKKALDTIKWSTASFPYISIALKLTYNKYKLRKASDY